MSKDSSPSVFGAILLTVTATVVSNFVWEQVKPAKSRDDKEVIIVEDSKLGGIHETDVVKRTEESILTQNEDDRTIQKLIEYFLADSV